MDKVVIMLTSGMSPATIAENAGKLGLSADQVEPTIVAARRRITIAAKYDPDTEVGTSYIRLNELHRRALAVQDLKTALAAQRELNRLLTLYGAGRGNGSAPEIPTGAAFEDAEAAREQLLALGIGQAGDSLAELARLAILKLTEATRATGPDGASPVRKIQTPAAGEKDTGGA